MGRETDDLMNAAERSSNLLTAQVRTVENYLENLRDQYTEIRGLANAADSVAKVDGALKKVVESQKTQKLVEQEMGVLAKLVPVADKTVKDLDSKVLKKAIKNLIPGWNQKALADAKALLQKATAAVETAKKKQAAFNALLVKQSKLLTEVEQILRDERVAIPLEDALETFCETTLDESLKMYVQVEKTFVQKQAVIGKLRNEVTNRKEWNADDRDARLGEMNKEEKELEDLNTENLRAVTRLLSGFWNGFNVAEARKSKSPTVQKLLTEANTRQQKMDRRITATQDNILGLITDLQSLRDELTMKARAGDEAGKVRAAGKKKALQAIQAVEVIAGRSSEIAAIMSVWTKREAFLKGVLKARPPLPRDVVQKLAEIDEGMRGDLRTMAGDTKQMATADKVAQNAYRLFQGEKDIDEAWGDAQAELTKGRAAVAKLTAYLEGIQKLVTAVKAAHPNA